MSAENERHGLTTEQEILLKSEIIGVPIGSKKLNQVR